MRGSRALTVEATTRARAAAALAALLTVVPLASWLARTRDLEPVLGWDQGAYFRLGQEILLHARARDWTGFERACREMVYYPPGFGLALAAWMGVTGPTPFRAMTFNIVLLCGCTALLYLVCRRSGSRLAGVLAGTMLLSSPALIQHAGDVLLEIPGLFLTLAFVAAYYAGPSLDAPFSSGVRRAAAGALLPIALLTKYHLPLLLVTTTLCSALADSWAVVPKAPPRERLRRFLTVLLFLAAWTLVPAAAWFAWIGERGRDSFLFFFTVSRSSHSQSTASALAHWSFYVRAIAERTFDNALTGPVVLVLAALAFRRFAVLARPLRWACCYVGITLVGLTLYPPRLDRLVLMALPLLCLVAGWEAARQLRERAPDGLLIAAVLVCAALGVRSADAAVRTTVARHRLYAGWINPAHAFIKRHLNPERAPLRTSFAGTSLLLSAHSITSLVEEALGRPGTPDFWLDRPRAIITTPEAEFDRWLEVREPGQVLIAIEVLPQSPLFDDDYRRFNATRTWAIPLAAATPRLVQTERLETPSGLRLTSWRLLPVPRAASP